MYTTRFELVPLILQVKPCALCTQIIHIKQTACVNAQNGIKSINTFKIKTCNYLSFCIINKCTDMNYNIAK